MASSLEYVQYVTAQLSGAGVISYKKLFGEYGLWCGREFLTALVLDTCSQLPDPSLPKRK